MTGEGAERHKLAAVMFTDMVGYSALALELLDIHHALIRQCLRRHQGRAIKTIGDAFMVEFSSAISAVDCAIEIQAQLNELNLSQKEGRRIDHRIGIHLGDVVERQEDLLGDGVNIAARLEPLAHPGAICVSEDVANQLRSRPRYQLEDLGLLELKIYPAPSAATWFILPMTIRHPRFPMEARGRTGGRSGGCRVGARSLTNHGCRGQGRPR